MHGLWLTRTLHKIFSMPQRGTIVCKRVSKLTSSTHQPLSCTTTIGYSSKYCIPTKGQSRERPQGTWEIRRLSIVNLQTHTKTYDPPTEKSIEKETPSSQSDIPLHVEKPPHDIVIRPPKSTLRKTTHNPNSWEAQHYSIVEDLARSLAQCQLQNFYNHALLNAKNYC